MAYSSDDIKSLYLDVDRIIKKKPQVSLEELSKELNTEIDLEQESCNVLGDLLLARAIEDSNLDFVKFLFKNKLRIISIASHEEESYHIIKTRDGRSILNHAIRFGNTEILDLLLQSINTEQKKLESESKLYKLRKKLEDNEIYDFYHRIDQIIQYDREANNLQHLQEQGRIAKGIKLQDKCKEGGALVGEIFLTLTMD
ncbi:MAG: ankyrin repeat domain-containing protein [Wolbachia sp.]